MDEERKTRFLVAPLMLLASLAFGAWLDPNLRPAIEALINLKSGTSEDPTLLGRIVILVVGGGIALFTSGFVIGTITYVGVRAVFWLIADLMQGSKQHEVVLPENSLNLIRARFGIVGDISRREELYAGAAFDHGILRAEWEGIHRWLMRRWGAFSINCTSVTALALSFVIGQYLGICFVWVWYLTIFVIGGALCAGAIWAWRDTMGMLAFLARVPRTRAPHGRIEFKGNKDTR